MSLGSVVILYSLYLVSVSGQELDQDISWTRKKGEVVSFSCKNNDWCTDVDWYQKKEGEPFTFILSIEMSTCAVYSNYDHPQEADFSPMRKKNNCDLKIQSVEVYHSAIYYCACGNHFGSGTRLYVTDNHVRKPKVTVYPASNPESNGKTTLICLARDMFPDLVKISWKMEDEYGQTVEVSKAETEHLEQREEGQTTSMIIIDKENACKNKYRCYVEHEGDPQDVDMLKDPFSFMCSLNLASLVYTVMIVKSMVYCCGLSLLLHHRNMGKWTQHL
uniref:Ig-like domain-containing protein n=1 Tax=Salmo trutta TaxID=8032 RepID=A0A673WTT4_SALTR